MANSIGVVTACVFDQFGTAAICFNAPNVTIGSEAFSSASGTGSTSFSAIDQPLEVAFCNVHDCLTHGIRPFTSVVHSIVAKNFGNGFNVINGNTGIQILNNYH
jgi:hypothetical protein